MNHLQGVPSGFVTPAKIVLESARGKIARQLTEDGNGLQATRQHIETEICPGLNLASISPRYYGFVTGGATPAAQHADNIVTKFDQNVQVHLPNDTISTDVEFHALGLLCELLRLEPDVWTHKIFTTGATASNVIGFACARDYVIAAAGKRLGADCNVAEHGLLDAMRRAEVEDVQVLTTVPHSSIGKAASIVGLGRSSLKDISLQDDRHRFDHQKLEEALCRPRTTSIIMVSGSEVNTGLFATNGSEEMQYLRDLADRVGAWIHVDCAFGALARVLPDGPEFAKVRSGIDGLELADSITGDGHKLLNVVGGATLISSSSYAAKFRCPSLVLTDPDSPTIVDSSYRNTSLWA